MGCSRSESNPPEPPNIVLIVIDTLRADHLGCYGYFRDTSPNIDAFAQEAVFFEQAYAPMATTLPSHVSLFTGLYPLEHGTLANVGDGGKPFCSRPGARSVTQILQQNGYTTGAFVSSAPMKDVGGLNIGFQTYDQPNMAQRLAQRTTESALRWLDVYGKSPFFLFVHYFDPHSPYQPPRPYSGAFRSDSDLDAFLAERAIPDMVQPGLCRGGYPTHTRRVTDLYDGEIRYCDEHVGALLKALRDRGLWESSAIILMADHGEGLNQHEWPQHGRIWNEQAHIPLMIRFPGVTPRHFEPLVSVMDVFPTVLAHYNLPWGADFLEQARGVNVLAPGFVERSILTQRSGRDCGDIGGSLFALTTPDWRFHWTPEKESRLFNRQSDPFELRDSAPEASLTADQLRRQTEELVTELESSGIRLRVDVEEPLLDPRLRAEMAALGYSETDGPRSLGPTPASATRPAESQSASQPASRPESATSSEKP